MPFGWEGEKVRLVPLDKERHFENCLRWLNDRDVTRWTLMGDMPLTRLVEEEFFERVMRSNDKEIILAIETLEEEHIGVTGIHAIDFRNGTATTGTLIGRTQLHGRGLGTDTIAVRTRYAFHTLGLRLLLTEAMIDNVASWRALQKNGYREYGRIPQRYWKRGAYRDAILLMLTREEWQHTQ